MLDWGAIFFRSFPWRTTANPYEILISEILLHRTKADQVTPVYHKFVETYPSVNALAPASFDDILHLIASLGLPHRAKTLLEMAQQLIQRHHGEIPQIKEELLALSGVGSYIASAVLCFAFEQAKGLFDTNTVRVTGRIFGLAMTLKRSGVSSGNSKIAARMRGS